MTEEKESRVREAEEAIEEEVEELIEKPTSVISGLIGNVMEWYDFALYGYMVPVISTLFFPSESHFASLIAAFGVFAAGFAMRPLGGFILGRIGDIRGRKQTLFISLVLMAITTSLLGLLPTYGSVGILAPVLLVALRLGQGLSVGGEFSTSVTYMVEEAPSDSRGIFGSLANIGSMSGMLLGSGMATVFTTFLPQSAVYDWGWRMPFLLAAVLGVLGIYFTNRLPESHMFKREKRHVEASPVEGVVSESKELLQALMYCLGYSVLFYLPLVYMPTYVNSIASMESSKALQITTLVTALLIFLIPLMAIFSDRFIRRKKILLVAFVVALALTYPLFTFSTNSYVSLFLVELIFALIISVPLGVTPATLVELFPTDHRLTAYSIVYNIGLGIFGGSAPMIATWLMDVSGNNLAPAFYLLGTVVISIIGLTLMKDWSREPLR